MQFIDKVDAKKLQEKTSVKNMYELKIIIVSMSKLVDKYKYDLFLQIDVSDIYELYIYILNYDTFSPTSRVFVYFTQ